MTVNYTTNLSLGQPVTGTESGTWGDDVNNAVTSYLDIAIAGGLAITVTTADVTLTITQGTSVATNIGSTTAQYAILNVSGAMTAARNLILPSSSRQYVINNACTGGFLLTVKGSATTGVTLVNGEKAHVFWNGSDYAKAANTAGVATFTSITNSGLTSGRVVFSTTGGLETDSAGLTFDGTNFATTGTATAAKLIPTGSSATGNGLYLPAANSVGISTNGANAVYIDSNQKIGFGVSSIPTNFRSQFLGTAGSNTSAASSGTTQAASAVLRLQAGGGFTATLDIGQGGGTGSWLQSCDTADLSINYPLFLNPNGGNVGIGTSSPSSRLAVNGGTSTSQIRWEVNNAAFTQEVSTNAAASAYVYKSNDASYHVWKLSSSEAMRIDSSGNVGIGNTSPQARFHSTAGATSQAGIFEAGNSVALLSFVSNATSSYTRVQLGAAGNDMVMYTTGAERARIDSSGNVGIGTTSPVAAAKMTVQGGGANGTGGIRLLSDNTYSNGANYVAYGRRADGNTSGAFAPGVILARINTAPAALVSGINLGRVAFGGSYDGTDANVVYGAQIAGYSSGTYSSISAATDLVFFTTPSGTAGGTTTGTADFGTERMRIDSSGNVGIGTTSPTVRLDTFGGYMRLRSNTTINADISGNVNALVFESSGGTGEHAIIAGGNASTNFLSFYTANSAAPLERMRIDSSGNLLVGRTSSSGLGQIQSDNGADLASGSGSVYLVRGGGNVGVGTSSPAARLSVDSGATGLMAILNSTATNGGYVTGQSSSTAVWDLGTAKQVFNTGTSTDVGLNTRSGFLGFGTANTERMRIDSSGNVGIGTSSPQSLLDLTGNDPTLRFTDNAGSPAATFSIRSTDGTLKFRDVTNSSDRVTIDSSGNLLVGTTTSPSGSNNLSVLGAINSRTGTTASLGVAGTETVLTTTVLSHWMLTANGNSNTTQYAQVMVYTNSAGGVTVTSIASAGIVISSPSANTVIVTNGATTQTISYAAIRIK